MTLLINELISLLEKDNKSNNDNSKIITANNPEKIYNNLISLLSKNIEDFITATESKEDILLRGLNDLKARREEQDTIASKVQYNNNNYKIIFYNVNILNKGIITYENYYNIPCRFVGLLFMLKNLKIG